MHKLGRLAEIINARLIGDAEAEVCRAQTFQSAVEGDITFAANPAYLTRVNDSRATAIIVREPIAGTSCNLLIASNPKLAFARAIQALHSRQYQPSGVSDDLSVGEGSRLGRDLSIHPRVTIGRDCAIGDRVALYPGVVIGDRCRIGDDTSLHANVTIYSDCHIGNRVTIHAGAVVGADGFGFVPDEEGRQVKLLQLGRVVIEDDCEVGANCTIDCGGFQDTILRRGVKLDNLIQVGHSSELGEHTVVAALTGFSGGTRVGRRCVIAGQVGTKEHITIGDGAIITGKAAVVKDVEAGARIVGMMRARESGAWWRSHVLYSKLPEMAERMKALEKAICDLQQAVTPREP